MRVANGPEDGEIENETDDLSSAVKGTCDDVVVCTGRLVNGILIWKWAEIDLHFVNHLGYLFLTHN